MWVPGKTNILQLLVSIQKKFLNSNPIFNEPTYAVMRGSPNGEQASFAYNEKILIKSLKTMLYILNKPPKNFEDFVVGHFRNRASDIILACSKKGCSAAFIEDLVLCVKFVTSAFKQTGALDRRVVMIGLKKHEVHLELKNYVVYK
uniref:putative ubiquitin-conjugating enzyme E2 38 n=1 Tax=Erigeron canadensis TaxID=72917 RepID=UPI001CB95B88|nr:putative ubiquitin-conjugating enzyme E2 38 [Erigeron canadensis]